MGNNKQKIIEYFNKVATIRDKFIRRNRDYYRDLVSFFNYNIPAGSKVLEIGCGTGYLLEALQLKNAWGIDISEEMIVHAKKKHPQFTFRVEDIENCTLDEKFDVIILSDTVGYFADIQKAFANIRQLCHCNTRIIITYQSFFWGPFLRIAEVLKLKMTHPRLNWLNKNDIHNLLKLEGYSLIKDGRRFLFPKFFPLLSCLCNKYLVHLPFFNLFGLTGYSIARPNLRDETLNGISIVIPARNEKGNIEKALLQMPQFDVPFEIIFIEGNSTDNTYEEIERVYEAYKDKFELQYAKQDSKGKGDAVRKGFGMARYEVLMILDADLTVGPEELPKFYNAIASGCGEYINGSRLVYPMEKEAMRFLNIMGNKFFSKMFSWLLGQRLKDTLCGTKVLSKRNWQQVSQNRSYFGNFDPFGDFDMIFGSAKLNLQIVEIPIRYKARDYGDTNISRFRHGWLLLKMVFFAMNKIKFV